MIAHLKGKLVEKNPAYFIIECGGVGYHVNVSLSTYSGTKNEESVFVHTLLIVREDAHLLYGFSTKEEREVFKQLISVSGVGASTAIMMLSSLSSLELQSAIIGGDVATLKNVKGIGAKTAQRIIVDLKDKIGKGLNLEEISISGHNRNQDEALSALTALGFDRSKADKAIKKIMAELGDDSPVELLVKQALKQF